MRLIKVINNEFSWGLMLTLPNQIAKKGKENAKAIIPILLDIENIIVKKGR
jgi:hypothetical protein